MSKAAEVRKVCSTSFVWSLGLAHCKQQSWLVVRGLFLVILRITPSETGFACKRQRWQVRGKS
eukprot:962612-Prorocentrum_lima.AAC.1